MEKVLQPCKEQWGTTLGYGCYTGKWN